MKQREKINCLSILAVKNIFNHQIIFTDRTIFVFGIDYILNVSLIWYLQNYYFLKRFYISHVKLFKLDILNCCISCILLQFNSVEIRHCNCIYFVFWCLHSVTKIHYFSSNYSSFIHLFIHSFLTKIHSFHFFTFIYENKDYFKIKIRW